MIQNNGLQTELTFQIAETEPYFPKNLLGYMRIQQMNEEEISKYPKGEVPLEMVSIGSEIMVGFGPEISKFWVFLFR